ncbi:MAG TPA: hypothetical protein VFP52_00420, partial [Myxococcales bacterium]|nr:hypothetical protein [Myxococcales bacterium]
MSEAAAADRKSSRRRSIAVATAAGEAPEEELSRVGWPLTVLRLALAPEQHPWRRGFRVRRRGPLLAVLAALLLLLLFAASGCSSTPQQSLLQRASAAMQTEGARCDTMLVSQEFQVSPQGELSDLRLTLHDLPEVVGPLRVLVRRPRFPARLELDAEGAPEFDKVLDVPARRQLTVVLRRGRGASDDWPRQTCSACRVDVELTGLFGAREALRAFFTRAMLEAGAVEGAFARQSAERAERPTQPLRAMADALSAEATRCHVQLAPALSAVLSALAQLDGARARFYARQGQEVPDAAALLRAWDSATASLEAMPALQSEARAAGWPASLKPRSAGRLRLAAAHLDLWSQIAAVGADDKPAAARWAALALAPDPAALEARAAALPP